MVAGAELASSGTVFGFAYSGEVNIVVENHLSPFSFIVLLSIIHHSLPPPHAQIKNQVGDVLKRDIMNFSEFDNSSTSYRVNSLQNKAGMHPLLQSLSD